MATHQVQTAAVQETGPAAPPRWCVRSLKQLFTPQWNSGGGGRLAISGVWALVAHTHSIPAGVVQAVWHELMRMRALESRLFRRQDCSGNCCMLHVITCRHTALASTAGSGELIVKATCELNQGRFTPNGMQVVCCADVGTRAAASCGLLEQS